MVFDPQTRTERPLVDYSNHVDTSQLSYCGEFSSPATAYQLGRQPWTFKLWLFDILLLLLFTYLDQPWYLALGNLDLHSLSRTSSFDPDTYRPPDKSAKFGSVAKHKSMWRKGYVKVLYKYIYIIRSTCILLKTFVFHYEV